MDVKKFYGFGDISDKFYTIKMSVMALEILDLINS